MKVLVTGAGGQLGRCLQDRATAFGMTMLPVTHADLDIADASAVAALLAREPVQAIINAAAYTAVDKAEAEREQAFRVNAEGPAVLARACAERGIPLLHVSTDYVFDGSGTAPYRETDPVAPLGVYGESKLAGEQQVRALCPDHVILRTAWVFSEYGNNFVRTMLRFGRERDLMRVVDDQTGCPTYAGDIADVLLTLLKRWPVEADRLRGTWHYAGEPAITWCGFAREIFAVAEAQGLLKAPTVEAIPTSAYPTPAKRPAWSVLEGSGLVALGIAPSPWRQRLETVVPLLMSAM